MKFTSDHFNTVQKRSELIRIAKEHNIPLEKTLKKIKYKLELRKLQSEFVNLQKWISQNKMRVAVLFEGKDASGKGGSIKRFKEHLNPRSSRVVALTKPTDVERGQWYFRRYIKELPNPGEIVFFDRSWYNRAVVEPVNKFCTKKEYDVFMSQVNDFEHMLVQSNTYLIKLYFSISKEEQAKRFAEIQNNPLKRWKMTPLDKKAQDLLDDYTQYKQKMFDITDTQTAPWHIINTDKKSTARLRAINHLLERIPYNSSIEK
jgi:polyphosphate kinase 2